MPDRATQIRDDLGAPARVGQKWLNERHAKASARPLAFGAQGAICLERHVWLLPGRSGGMACGTGAPSSRYGFVGCRPFFPTDTASWPESHKGQRRTRGGTAGGRCRALHQPSTTNDGILRATLMTAEWPFDQPRNCAIITLKSITSGDRPILLVTHDLEDHGWQFLDGHDVDESDATIIGFAEIVELDASLLELADLPPGWRAWRASPTDPWRREAQTGE
jgi:hypothetical protein